MEMKVHPCDSDPNLLVKTVRTEQTSDIGTIEKLLENCEKFCQIDIGKTPQPSVPAG